MSKIKLKETAIKTIKTVKKGISVVNKANTEVNNIKSKVDTITNNDESVMEYSSRNINSQVKNISNKGVNAFNYISKKSIKDSKEYLNQGKEKIKNIKESFKMKKESNISTPKIKLNKNVVSNDKKQLAEKMKITGVEKLKEKFRSTYNTSKKVSKALVSSVKGILTSMKVLITFLVAGFSIAFFIVLVICLIGLLLSSMFGIFFSSEKKGTDNEITMNMVINEINREMADKIIKIQKDNTFDDYMIETHRADWKDILIIYTAKLTNGNDEEEVITMDENKKEILKEVFWDMNKITHKIKEEEIDETLKEEDSNEDELEDILYITVESKTLNEMMDLYNFNDKQRKQVAELLSEDYSDLWGSVIFGTSSGSPTLVQIALNEVGNVGGKPYWSWYGFKSRIEWCAVFVSWVANEAGYIDSGVLPKFAGCLTGINWFKAMNEWQDKGYIPEAGDIIFFDWELDGKANHVGIVEKVENNIVYTIEGNSDNDTCRRKEYPVNSPYIFGYGTPAY